MLSYPPDQYFDLSSYRHKELFLDVKNVWDAFGKMEAYLERIISEVPPDKRRAGEIRNGAKLYGDNIVIEEGALVEPTTCIRGSVWNGKTVRAGVYEQGEKFSLKKIL